MVALFDLDETLMVEEPAAVAAFRATAAAAAARYPELDADALATGARARAGELWRAAPTHPYCKRIGISSWEGLWCRYAGSGAEMSALRAWAAEYRQTAWRLALADQGVHDAGLAAQLGERFVAQRRARHEVFADAPGALRVLKRSGFVLGLVTNGAPCLQRDKLAASGLAPFFDVVVVSGDVGEAKPSALPFQRALSVLGAEHAVMIGDSVEKDIRGALRAGLDAVWVNRSGLPRPDDLDVPEVAGLGELPVLLERGVRGGGRLGPSPSAAARARTPGWGSLSRRRA